LSGVRAVVLAAGLGTRLRPLTEFEPKPLLPVGGRPLIAHTLDRLQAGGCEAVALNLFHLGNHVQEQIGNEHRGMPITYSPETELLGTLGALAPLRDFWRGADVLVVINGDSLCRWPVRRLLRRHGQLGARATLLVSRTARVEEYGGGVGLDMEGRFVSPGPGSEFGEVEKRRVFAGAHALSPGLLEEMEPPLGDRLPADFIRDLYLPMLERQEVIQTVETRARWFESGTPEFYLRSVRGWVGNPWLPRWLRGSWLAPETRVDSEAKVSRSVVEKSCVIEKGARVERSLLLPGARVSAGCTVRNSIVGFGVTLPADTSIERRLVTPERSDVPPRPVDSTVGGLVYSPLRPPTA
jgi:mannose-1-phosphate guanylyltransferase